MIQISYWAKKHKYTARTLIALLHTLLVSGTIYIAILLNQLNVQISYTVPTTAIVLSVIAVLLYQSGKAAKGSFVQNYFRRKGCEFIFLWSVLMCICFVFNKDSRLASFNTYPALSGSFVISKEEVKETPTSSLAFSKKNVRKQFKELLKELRKNNISSLGKTGLIVLVVLGGIALSFLLLGLSCSLSCDGNGALATVVLAGGLAAVIFLMVLAIKKINRSNGQK